MKEENNLFRMNFVIQDNAATTLDANLVKIVEAILYNTDYISMSIQEIQLQIEKEIHLTFSIDELKAAIKRKGKNIQIEKDKYFLSPAYRNALSQKGTYQSELKKYIKAAIHALSLEVNEDTLFELLTEYLYYCFNSNKNTLLALIQNKQIKKENNLNFNNNEIKLINAFLSWNNDEKNKLIYNVISYCFIYCTLTVKKDSIFANRLFRGKRFILDANIIFRLAGINNDVRKFTINSFIDKCKEVGIELCYSSATLDEIYRVITNKVQWIRAITNCQEPLDLTPYSIYENDFYKLYYLWCKDSGNKYDDYTSFQNYLNGLISNVIGELNIVEIPNYEIENNTTYEHWFNSLKQYKATHTSKEQSNASLSTDVNNALYVKLLRAKNKNNVWATQEYFISADQNLIAWSSDIYSGIPLIVLPSVWLTIILRFSGRTSNDYKAFCSFLELRIHISQDSMDVYQLVEQLAEKTSSSILKEKIVREVYEHKKEYSFNTSEDYKNAINKAFDAILSQASEEDKKKYFRLEQEIRYRDSTIDNLNLEKTAEEEKRIRLLVDRDCKRHFRSINAINRIKLPCAFIIFISLIVLAIFALKKKGILYNILLVFNRDLVKSDNLLTFFAVAGSAIFVLAFFINAFLAFLGNGKRQKNYRDKRAKYYKNLFTQNECVKESL